MSPEREPGIALPTLFLPGGYKSNRNKSMLTIIIIIILITTIETIKDNILSFLSEGEDRGVIYLFADLSFIIQILLISHENNGKLIDKI